MAFTQISVEDAKQILEQEDTIIIDIRDDASYKAGHIPGAQHITNDNVETFIKTADLDNPVIVYCYHGNSSQGAADFLSQQGFNTVYSMMGGYSAWSQKSGLC